MNLIQNNIFTIPFLIEIDKLNISMKKIMQINLRKNFLTIWAIVTVKKKRFSLLEY